MSRTRKRRAEQDTQTSKQNDVVTRSNVSNAKTHLRNKRRRAEATQPEERESIDTDDSDLETVKELTSTRTEVNRLQQKFQDIFRSECTNLNKTTCVFDCDRKRATVLLPCSHQPTCNQCFVLWKLYVTERKSQVFCPICRMDVISHIAVNPE